jgi:phosphohistidine phosphatase
MTIRRLVLVRHAKAADGDLDIERPLSPRGLRDADEIGHWLAGLALVPDRVVTSPARRTVQTWAHAASVLGSGVDPLTDARIYDNTAPTVLSVIHETPDAVHSLVLVGHNPSMTELVLALDDELGDPSARRELRRFPTGGVAVFDVHPIWSELVAHTATLIHFACPRA